MRSNKTSRRRRMSSRECSSNGEQNGDLFLAKPNSVGRHRSSSARQIKMNENLRTSLLYLFALMTTWLLFCFLTFAYFTSISEPYDDHRHKFLKKSDIDSDVVDQRGQSIIDYKSSDNIADHPAHSNIAPQIKNSAKIDDRKIDESITDHQIDTINRSPTDRPIDKSITDQIIDSTSPSIESHFEHVPCYGLCPPAQSGHIDQLDYVVLAVQKHLRQQREGKVVSTWETTESKNDTQIEIDIPPTLVIDLSKISKASLPAGGIQAKLIFHMQDGTRLVFKPEIANENLTQLSPKKDSCRITGKHSSELAAYYLSLLLPVVRVPEVAGVTLNFTGQVWPKRDKYFSEHSWKMADDGRLCFKSNCRFCRKPICADIQGMLKGAISIWIPPASLSKFDNPWSEVCPRRGTEKWRHHADFCQNRDLQNGYPFFDNSSDPLKGLRPLIDTSIFDYLIDYPDRHLLHYVPEQPGFVLFDNSKAFVDSHHSDLAILAPLFQCCRIDRKTFVALNRLVSTSDRLRENTMIASRFAEAYHRRMIVDSLYPFIDNDHVDTVERRLRKVIAVVNLCLDRYGADLVFEK